MIRRPALRCYLFACTVTFAAAGAASVHDRPVPVSPGRADRVVGIGHRCPTFSWTPVPGAGGYELVVWELTPDAGPPPSGAAPGELEPVLHEILPPATSWTPDLGSCLERPGRFAWFVRALGARGGAPTADDSAEDSADDTAGMATADAWSRPRIFELRSEAASVAALRTRPPAVGARAERPPEAVPEAHRVFGDLELALPGGSTESARDPSPRRQASPTAFLPGPAGLDATSANPGGAAFGVRGTVTAADVNQFASGVYGEYQAAQGPRGIGVIGVTRSQGGAGVFARATDSFSGTGVYGVTDAVDFATGVFGYATSTSGPGIGVWGQSNSTDGGGIGGDFVGYTGVRGRSNQPGGTAGLFIHASGGLLLSGCTTIPCNTLAFEMSSTGDLRLSTITAETASGEAAISATSTSAATFARGVFAESTGATGRGVFGDATATSGDNAGVVGRSYSADGTGGLFVNQAGGDILRGQTAAGERFRVEGNGSVFADGSFNCGLASSCFNAGQGADLAERIDPTEPLEPGDVVEVDPTRPGRFRKSRGPLSPRVLGVVSTQPAITLNNADLAGGRGAVGSDRRPLLALAGKVPVKVSDEAGAIAPGDQLVSSSTPGVAMRCPEAVRCLGATLGKALEHHAGGRGTISMMVFSN